MIEIEKTFLVKKVPEDLTLYKSLNIKQGYISPVPSPLRIRQKGSKFELTKKISLKDGDFSSANELSIPLTEGEFKQLWSLVEKSLEKTRYIIPIAGGLIAELDIFQKELKGLFLVEVEFTSQELKESFIAPEWFGRDVTQEAFSANVFLAGKSFSTIQKYL